VSVPSWTWTWLDDRGSAVEGPLSPAFTSRFDAEVWLGQVWRERAAEGVATARLERGDGARVPAADVDLTAAS